MVISFAGHAMISSADRIKETVKEQIQQHICHHSVVTCYLGGYGDFDAICACACRELKQEGVNLKRIYVTPYMSLSEQAKIKEMQRSDWYDGSLYPPIEKTPLKFAIAKRNEWMMTNADLIIAYVHHSYGGAYRSLQVAKRKKKKIVNIDDFLL